MKLFSKAKILVGALLFACLFAGCDDVNGMNSSGSGYTMHYFFTNYGGSLNNLYSAMIRTADNSDVAILSTTQPEKGGDLYDGTFVTLTKTVNGNTYTFSGSKAGTTYTITGSLTNTSNGTTNNSFTISSSSESMQSLGFTADTSIQHWTERKSGVFVY